jgi:hypothetical protein
MICVDVRSDAQSLDIAAPFINLVGDVKSEVALIYLFVFSLYKLNNVDKSV